MSCLNCIVVYIYCVKQSGIFSYMEVEPAYDPLETGSIGKFMISWLQLEMDLFHKPLLSLGHINKNLK